MNLDIFRKQLIKAYNQTHCNYCIEDVFYIFVTYFEYYSAYTNHTHPPIKTNCLIAIIDSMSICGDIDLDAIIRWYEAIRKDHPGYRREMYEHARDNLQYDGYVRSIIERL